ncbi:MAG: thiamine diphosphokinase [Clostridia bacterium]|jgi:thiamine pyrophosphokinase|nr:thiamine diphosphokinase [Clostridia bacterium]
MKAAIICNGSIQDYDSCKDRLQKVDTIICADGGTRHLYHMNIIPHVIIGDLDSTKGEYIEYYKSKQVSIIQYSSDKDKTDTHICLEYALERYDEIVLLGATGSRLDHTLGNISILKMAADKGKKACIVDEKNELYVVKDGIKLQGKKGDLISLLPLSSKVEGINFEGVSYPLHNAVMEIGDPYGVSNCFNEDCVTLTIKSGYMIVTKSVD